MILEAARHTRVPATRHPRVAATGVFRRYTCGMGELSATNSSSALIAALAASEDPILAYRAGLLLAGASGGDARHDVALEAVRARIPASPTARALLRGRDTRRAI